MEKQIKKAFLILRVEESFKKRVMAKATELGQTVSEFVRRVLTKKM